MAVTTKVTSVSLDLEIENELNKYADETGVKKSTVINRVLKEFFESKKLPRKKNQN